jgi:hypothetical protein
VSALITTRILVQFIGQVFAIPLLRKKFPDSARPYKMWLYPLPAIVAFFGWGFVFATSGWGYVAVGLLTMALGLAVFLIRAKITATWPFRTAETA